MMQHDFTQELKKLMAQGKTLGQAADTLREIITDLEEDILQSQIEEAERKRKQEEQEQTLAAEKELIRARISKMNEEGTFSYVPAEFRPIHEAYLLLVEKGWPKPHDLSPADLAEFIEAVLRTVMDSANQETICWPKDQKKRDQIIKEIQTYITQLIVEIALFS